MRSMLKLLVALFMVVTLVIGTMLTMSGIGDFGLPSAPAKDMVFQNGDIDLHGTFISGSDTGPIVLIVHGDGAQDRWSAGNVLPLVNALVDAGLSVFSWDKPGIGSSTGNWLQQTMQDRAAEAAAALAAIRAMPGGQDRTVGFLGFSQAGWVLPRLPSITDDVDFLVLVGPAINWRGQGRYFATVRMLNEGLPREMIAAELTGTMCVHSWLRGSPRTASF